MCVTVCECMYSACVYTIYVHFTFIFHEPYQDIDFCIFELSVLRAQTAVILEINKPLDTSSIRVYNNVYLISTLNLVLHIKTNLITIII